MQVRDHALGLKDEMPKSDVNKEYYTQNAERQVSKAEAMKLFAAVWPITCKALGSWHTLDSGMF